MNCTINNVNLSFDEGNRLRETINRVSKSDANKATILAGFLTNIDFRKFLLENITNEDIIKGESISFDLFTNKDYLKLNQNKLGFLLNEFYKDTYLSVDNSKTIRGMGRLNGFTSITAKKIAKDYTAVLLLKEYRQELNKNSKNRRKPLEIIKVVNDKIESTFYKRMDDFILYIINDENSSKEAKEMAQKYIDFIDNIENIKQQYNDNELLLNSNKTQKEEFEQQIININQQIKEAKQNKDANTFKRLVKEVTEIKNAIKEIDKVLNEINIQQKRHSENVYTIYRDRYALAYNIVTLYHNNYDAPQAVKLRNYMNLFIQSKLNADDWYFQVFNTKNMTSIIKAFNTVEDIEKYLEQEDENSDNVINKYNQYNIDETTKSWEDALYKNFNQTINNKLRIILSTIPKLANKYNNLNEIQSTDTENELGVETYMDAQYLTVQIYSFGDFSNVNSLIKSLDKKSQEIKAIYGLGTIVQMMKNNKDFANFVFVNFAKPIANKTILTISEMSKEDGIKFDYSNPDSFPLTELVFRMSNKLKATYNSTYNSNDIKELNDILEAFNTNKNKEIFVHDLFKMVNKYFPNFNKEIFNNYFDNIKDEDLKDSADTLIRSFKSIINGITNFKQKLNEITNKYDEEYKLAKEKYFEDIKIYNSLTSVQKINTPKPEFPQHKYVNYASYDLNSDIYKGIIEFSKQIINYTDSRARLNSTNAEGNSSSNVLKNCFVTRFFEQINAETEIDPNAGLNNLKDYFTQGTKDGKENQYSHNSLLFGLTDENGFVQHEGLFRKTATGYEVTENAKKIISYSLFDGTKNTRELKSANYSSMTKIDFFITQYIAFRDSVEEISENGKIKNIGKLDSAVYPMRIGADAPKIFFIRAPRYTKNQVQYSFYGHLMDEFNMFIKGINEIFIPENETVEDGQIVQIFKTRTDVHNLIGRAFFNEKIANKLKNEGKTDMTPAIVKDGELCGNLFSFKRLFKVNGYDVDSAIKTMLSLYGGVDKNGIITIDNDGRLRLNKNDIIIYNSQTKSFELNFNTEQKNQLKQIVREWTENFLFETNNSLSDFIKTLKENNIPFNLYTLESFLLNLANMNMNYDDLFEGDFKYYNNARDFLKRTKETQAGGEGYAGYDITEKFINNNLKELIWNNEPEVIQIDSDIVDKKGNITKQPITINNKTLIAKNGFRGITIYNTVKTSDYVDDMQKELERIFTEQGMDKEKAVEYSVQIAKGYGFAGGEKTKINDAQSYITFEEFIRRKWADGTINDYADLIKKLTDDTPIEELDLDKINTRIQIQKNFYYDKVYDETTGLFYPRQIKNAEFVLIPKLLPEGSELRKIHDWMQDNNIGQLNTAETSKAAKKNIFTIWDAETGKFNENFKDDFDESYIENYYYQYLYKQQDVPQHIMDEHNKAGVQIMKKIIDNIINEEELNLPDDENGNEHPLKTRRKRLIKLANDYQDAFTANIKEDFNNFLNAMDWIYNTNTGKIENLYYATKDAFGNQLPDDVIETNKTTLNFDNFYARAREEAARLGMDSNFMEYLIPNEFGNPNMPNYINIVTFKLESIAQSIYNNKITRQVLPGWHAAQITNVGYSTRLKFDPKTGVMEVLLPRWSNLIPKCKNKEEEAELIQQMQTEGLDIHLGYRIPTEGKQSISILKVVGFVNDALGSTIVVPDEWVTQTGSDFDVDSVYGISWEIYLTKDKNNKISLHKIPYKENEINEKNLYIKYVNNILDYRLSKNENSSENDIDSFINLDSKIKSSVKNLKDDLNKIDERQELNESYNIINDKRDELFNKLPSWARGIIKIIDLNNRKTNQKENNVVDIRETFPIIQESLINYLNKHKINKEDSDIVKEYVDYVNAIIDILNQQDGLPAFDKEVYLSEKSNIIRELIQKAKDENFAKYEKQAVKYNLLSFKEWSKLPFVEKLDRKARNNFIIDTMIKIMSDETSKEEQYSRSHFENIINGENGANDIIDKISGKNNRNYSPYNPIDQLDYMEDSMEGAKLKALSVNWDTFISKNNKIRCIVEDTDAVQVVLNVDENAVNDSAINYNEDEIRNSYGDDITDYKMPKIDTDKEYSSSIKKLSVGTITMEMDYGNEKRDDVKATNTFNAIKNGERTATTRYEKDGNLDYIKKFKVGDIIKIRRNNNYIYVKITKADYLPKNTSAEEWSKKEGWSVGHFYRKVQSEINKGEAYQLEFEYIEPNSNNINNYSTVKKDNIEGVGNNIYNYVLYTGSQDTGKFDENNKPIVKLTEGGDAVWGKVAKELGIKTVAYSPNTLKNLNTEQLKEVEKAYKQAFEDLQRTFFKANTYRGGLVRRDYLQAKAGDAVFAIGHIIYPGERNKQGYINHSKGPCVDGDTGYAVQMAINLGKPVHVFDYLKKQWYVYDVNQQDFVKESMPQLTPKFTGIGTRDIEGVKWIENVVKQVYLATRDGLTDNTEEIDSDDYKDELNTFNNNKRILFNARKIGFSNNNRNTVGQLITTYASQTTAHHLDAVKMGSIPNVNLYTFSTYKYIVSLGIDYETVISFIRQPIITNLVNNYNSSNSIFISNTNNPIKMTLVDIVKKLGIKDGKREITYNTSNKRLLELLSNDYEFTFQLKKLFGIDISIMSIEEINDIKVPLDKERMFARIRRNVNDKGSNVENLAFDFCMLFTFKNIRKSAEKINQIQQVLSSDNYGAENTLHQTRQIVKTVEKLRQENTLTRDGVNIIDLIFPLSENNDIDIDKSEYKSIAAIYKYATKQSLENNTKLFITENEEFDKAEEEVTKRIRHKFNESEYKEYKQYSMIYLYNQIQKLLSPISLDNKGNIIFNIDQIDLNDTELNSANQYWNKERSRIYGYGVNTDGDFEINNINKPTKDELNKFMNLTPAQKVLFMQKHFPDNQGIFNSIKITILNNTDVKYKGINRQYLSFDDQITSIEDLLWLFSNSFSNKNKLIKLTCIDIIKYAFIAEGFAFRSGYISKIIPNETLYTSINEGGLDIINEIKSKIEDLALQIQEDQFIDLYVRSHSNVIPIKRLSPLPAKEYVPEYNEYVYKKSNESTKFLEHIREDELIHIDTTTNDKSIEYLCNSLNLFNLVGSYTRIYYPINEDTNKITLYKVIGYNEITNEIGDIIAYKDYYLMPLNLLDKYECYEYSYNQNYNIYNSPEYYISTINELNTKIKSYRDILTKYIGTKKYDTYNQQVSSIANKNTSAIYNPIGNYTTNNIDFANQYTLMELYDRADDFTKGGVQKLINGIIGHIIDKEDNFSTPYVQFNPNISLSRLIPKESSVSQTIVLPNGTEIKVNIKHEKITSKFENNINDMLLGKKDKGIYKEAIQEMEDTKTLIKNANLYTITKEKENPEVLKNNALKAATDLIIDEDNNFVKEKKSLPRRETIDKVSSAIINEIHYEARKNQTPIAKSFVYELDKHHVNRAMGSSLVENRGNIYKAASRYYRSAANVIINKLNNFQMKDENGNPVVYSMDDPEMYEALAKNDEYFREVANIILQGITFGNRIIDILKLDISGEDKETKEAIEEIINNINSIKQNKKLLDAMNNLINIYFKKYSTNPEIIRDVLNLRESFGDLDQIDALIADPTDIDNNEVQLILKQVYSTIAKAEMFDAKRNVEEYKKELDKIKAMAGTIDMNNIIDSSRGMIRQFHNDQYLIDRQKVIDDLNIAYNNRNNSYEDYKKYIIAKYNRDKFMYDTTEQHILDEYYKKDLEIRKNAMDYAKDIYFKYLQLSQELHLEYPNETEEERDARKVKIISQMSQFRSEIDEIGGEKTEEEKAKVRALNKFLNERTELLEKYFESKEYDGFQENYKKYKDYIDKYNASHTNETLQEKLDKDVNYREAYNWINTNGHVQFDKENSKKLKNAFKVLLSRKNVIKNTTIAKLKTVEGVIDINGRINPTKLTDEQIKLIRDEEIEDLNTIYDTSYSEITLINDVHVKVPLIRSYPKKENNDEKAYNEFKYSNNAEKIKIINKINNILSKCIDKDTGYIDYNVLFNNNYISDSEREELANLYDKLSALNRPIKNKYKKRKNQIFLEATDDIAFMNAMNFYKRIANSKQGKQFLQIFTKVDETGKLVANPYIFGYLTPSDAEYVDHDKTNALRFIEDNVQFVTNEYYDIAKKEAQEKGYEAYDEWFKLNHVYNPYKHAWVPLKIWTKLEAKPGSELAGSIRYVPNFNNLEKTVKSEYINNAENRKRVGLKGEGYKEFSNNYKIGNAKYDSNLNLNSKEKALRDLYVTTLNKYATTYKGKRFVGQGYLPREHKSIKNLQWGLGQIGSLLGISVHNNADSDSFHTEVDYSHDREAEMKMLSLLEDKGTKKYIPLPIKSSMSDEEYAKEVNKVREENRKISINNEKIDNALFNNNWEEVMEDFIHNATIFNARQATKPFLYLLLEDLNINNAYMIKGLWGKKLVKDSNVSTIDDTIYQTVKQTRTREIVHNLARRLLYEQYHERSVHRSIANFLQNLTSAKYMIFNLYGGIANIATGKVNISVEQYANEYFGFTEFAKAEKQYLSNSVQMLSCLYSDKAVNITTALIKKFNIVDIDQILQFNAGNEDLDKQLERVRNFLYSFQSIGEHYMQNSVLLAMLKSNRLYTDKDGVRRIGDFKTFSWDIERQAMEYVLKDNDILLANYKAFIDNMKYAVDIKYDVSTGKKDINRMFLHSLRDHGETDIKNSYKKIATAYHKKRDDLMKDAKEEFLKNKTVEELFTFENGQAVIKKDILEEFNSKGKNPIGDLEYLIAEFKEKVIRVNNKIHGVYNKNGAAQLEKKWYGSLIMQYHKHLYNGIFKRWRKKGFYSEFRGSKERGAYITLINFLGTEFVNIKNDIKNRPQDGSNIVLHSIQVVMKATLNTFINISLNWNNLSNWERSNIKRILGDLSGALAAVLIVIALYSMYDEDEIKDDTFKASLLYLADRLYSDSTMFSPIGLVTEYKTAWSSPIASANGPSDLLKAMLLIPQALFDPDYNPKYQSGQYAGHNKLEILLRRNIPGIRPYDRIQFITKNNKYYKVGESQIGINIAKNFGETLND